MPASPADTQIRAAARFALAATLAVATAAVLLLATPAGSRAEGGAVGWKLGWSCGNGAGACFDAERPALGGQLPPDRQPIGPRPQLEKQCGAIRVHGETLRVDVTETIGAVARSCRTGRRVMRRFVKTGPAVMGIGRVRDHGRRYDCYRSRPDGEGWDYHCNWSSSSRSGGLRHIDFGAGRRF